MPVGVALITVCTVVIPALRGNGPGLEAAADVMIKSLTLKSKLVSEIIVTSINPKTQQACQVRLQTEAALFLQDVVVIKETVVRADNHEVQLTELSGRLASDERVVFVSRCYQYNTKRLHFILKPV